MRKEKYQIKSTASTEFYPTCTDYTFDICLCNCRTCLLAIITIINENVKRDELKYLS